MSSERNLKVFHGRVQTARSNEKGDMDITMLFCSVRRLRNLRVQGRGFGARLKVTA